MQLTSVLHELTYFFVNGTAANKLDGVIFAPARTIHLMPLKTIYGILYVCEVHSVQFAVSVMD